MNILGIVVEYNPFHLGHLHHLTQAKALTKADFVIAIMSGHFTQRGLPAVLDKYQRTQLALHHGIDVVLELPVVYATASANTFALGAVAALSLSGATTMAFGAETPALETLQTYATLLNHESEAFSQSLKAYLAQGLPYPTAREKALAPLVTSPAPLRPNNILGIEYLRAIETLEAKIQPFALPRNPDFASATSINQLIREGHLDQLGDKIPPLTHQALTQNFNAQRQVSLDAYSGIFHYLLRHQFKELETILDMNEGLEYRFLKASDSHFLLSEVLMAVKSKRYTLTRLQRIVVHTLLNITQSDPHTYLPLPYLRVLGFKQSASHLLKDMNQVPLLTNPKTASHLLCQRGQALFAKEVAATDLYHLGMGTYLNQPIKKGAEYSTPIIRL